MIKGIIILSVVLLIIAVVLVILIPLGVGRPITYLDENGTVLKGSVCEKTSLRDTAMHELGVGTTRYMHSVITGILFPSLQVKAYTQTERIHIWKGKIRSFRYAVVYEAWHFNAFHKVPSIEIPIFFFAGKYDYTCCYSLQQQYYEQINAPEKKFYTFEESAHSPLFEEPEKAISILKNEIIM